MTVQSWKIMVAIPLGVSNYIRMHGKSAPILMQNLYTEKDPSNLVDGLVRLQRPALDLFTTLDNGPIGGVFQQAGTFNGDYIVVTGGAVYRLTQNGVATLLGSIGTAARCIIAGSADRVIIATGGVPYSTDGVTMTAIVMPSGENVTSVEFLNNYFILTVAETQRYFYIAPGETNPDALSFAPAEHAPDDISVCKRLGDELWFFGDASTEVHIPTGVSDLPFKRISGRLYDTGTANRYTLAATDNSLFWVGTDWKVYRAAASPQRISDHGIEEALRRNGRNDNLSAWAFAIDGHTFYCLTIGDIGTFVHDAENPGSWLHWYTYGRDTWRAWIGTPGHSAPVLCGDDTNGKLYLLDPTLNEDDGVTMVRQVVGGVQVLGKPVRCDSVVLYGAVGWTENVDEEPFVEINFSDNQGASVDGPWIQMSMGRQGDYNAVMSAWQLGMISPPGRIFYWRCTHDVNFRASFARLNEI